MFRTFLLFCLFSVPIAGSFAQPITSTVKRIVFLGNSITWAANYVNDVEAFLRANDRTREWEFINVGVPSETVSGLSEPGHAGGSFPRPDLHERLTRVLNQTKPDLVFACYGMNDGIYLPLDKERFKLFKDGINWLHTEVEKTGARLIHLTPPCYDERLGKSQGYAHVLDVYAAWLLQKRKDGWEVIDIHTPMKKYLQAHRKVDAKFHLEGFALSLDGVHPGELGHWLMARSILTHLGFQEVAQASSIVASLSRLPNPELFVKRVAERQNMLRDAWLTETKHKRPGLPVGLPLPEAEGKARALLLAINSMPGYEHGRRQ